MKKPAERQKDLRNKCHDWPFYELCPAMGWQAFSRRSPVASTFVMIALSCILVAAAQAAGWRDVNKDSRRRESRGFVRIPANDNRTAQAREHAAKAKRF
jgi:hypothetical protein